MGLLAAAGVIALSDASDAGPLGRRKDREEPAAVEAPKLDVPRLKGKLFPKELPVELGDAPAGLANVSAQGCAACHPQVAAQWSAGPHARGPSDALTEAARGRPACLTCHLPLAAQHASTYTYDGGRLDRPVATANPGFQATLSNEAVTCAACHVRDGAVVVGGAEAAAAEAPHPMVLEDQLAGSEACAGCHQLTWPGTDTALYDTYGEWERGGFGALGISCQACHMQGGADGALGADHRVAVTPAQAVSVLLDAPTLAVVRGGAPVTATLTLQNTGAGHAFPTGSPFRGVRVRVALVHDPEPGADPSQAVALRTELLSVDLARRIQPEAPFAVLGDTRLQPGASQRWDLPLVLPQEVPAGRWRLVVTLDRTVGERVVPGEPALVERSWPLEVE